MDRMKKRPLFIILLAFLTLGVFYVATCSHLCPSGNHGIGLLQHVNCALQSHSFAYIGIGLFVLSVLPLMGLFLLTDSAFSRKGLNLSPFRPPQSHS